MFTSVAYTSVMPVIRFPVIGLLLNCIYQRGSDGAKQQNNIFIRRLFFFLLNRRERGRASLVENGRQHARGQPAQYHRFVLSFDVGRSREEKPYACSVK